MTLEEAHRTGLVVVIHRRGKQTDRGGERAALAAEDNQPVEDQRGSRTVIVTDDDQPVSISVSGQDVTIEDRRLRDEQEDPPVAFGPETEKSSSSRESRRA